MSVKPPAAKKIPFERCIHEDTRIDNYDWLKDPKDPEVVQILNGENTYFRSYFSDTDLKLKNQIVEEIKTKIEKEATSVEICYGEHSYFTKSVKGENYKHHLRRHVSTGFTETLLNENDRAAGRAYFAIRNRKISPDLKKIAWCIDVEGSGKCSVEIQCLTSKEILATSVEQVPWGTIAWAPDSDSFFYLQANEAWRADSVWHYKDGQKKKVFFEPDELFNVHIKLSSDSRFLLVESSSFAHSKAYYWNGTDFEEIFRTKVATLTRADHSDEGFVVLSNHKHRNFGIYMLEKVGALIDEANEIIPPEKNAKIVEIALSANAIAYLLRFNGLDELYIFDLKKGKRRISFLDSIYSVDVSTVGSPTELLVNYSSPSLRRSGIG